MNSLPTLFPGSNKNAIAAVLRDAIVNLCKVSKIYDGWIEIDGIICISGKVEGQQLVVKVHESFRPHANGKSLEGKESFGDDKEYKEEFSGFKYPHRKKRQRLDSKSETARNASTATLYDLHAGTIGSSRSIDESYKNGVEDLSVKKYPEFSDGAAADKVAITRSNSDGSGLLSVNFDSKVHQTDDELKISNDESGLFRGGLLCRQKLESGAGEKWGASKASAGVVPECRVCGCSFDSSEALSDHNEALHSLFTCLCCFKTFTSRSNLERHSRLHTGHRPYMCSVCGKAFSRKDHLSNHATKHAFKCSTCSKRYADRGSLVSHYHVDHCASLTNICDYCNKGFSSRDSFEDHVKIHPQFQLAESSGTPEDVPNDDTHEMTLSIHSSANRRQGRPNSDGLFTAYNYGSAEKLNSVYTCFVCSQSFDHPLQYHSHLLIHSNEVNVFKCSLCLQVCSTLAQLRQHQALHFSELSEYLGSSDRFDSFACTRCDQRFHNPFHLQLHLERHNRLSGTQLQEYMGVNEINLQEQHRASLANLDNHLRVMHQTHLEDQISEKFECIKCNVNFRDNSSFARHMEDNEHAHTADNGSKISRKDKRKQMQPKPVVLTKGNVDDRETEAVASESPELIGQEARNPANSLDILPSNQSAVGKLENEISCEIRLEPVRKLMSRPFVQHPKDWERLMDNRQSVVSGENPFGCFVRETPEDRGNSPEIIVQSSSFDRSSSSHTFDDYRLSKGCRSVKHYLPPQRCQSVSPPPTVTGCLNNNNNNIVVVSSRPFVCAFCDLKSETFSELDVHCQTEHSRSPCMFCTKTFAQKANRDRHHCLHTGDKPYGCPDCEERFSRGDKLKMHRVRVHGMQYPAFSSSSTPKDSSPPVQDCATSLSPGLYSCDGMYQQSLKNEQVGESAGPQDVVANVGATEEKVTLPVDILYPVDISDENRERDSVSQPLPLSYRQPNGAAEGPNTSMPTDS